METNRICPSCQKPLPPDFPLGLCPECLIKSGFNTGKEPGNPGKESGFVPPPVEELRKLFPQLEILELIGKGGMGAVYKARQPGLDRLVALKILPPGAADDAGFAERFNREARALARLNHPHIVAVHDFGQTGGQPYLVMEFVDGPNLRQVEQAGRLTPEQALEIVPQICEALQFAHNEGVVHRDIKPENILLDKKGRVKITDFGIAKIVGVPAGRISLTGAKDVLGTPHYMAPEQVEKPSTVDHRADIYSLGVVFYELLTGELPLGKFQPPSKKVQVDVRLDEVVLHTLEKEPERRYQHASEVKSDVETIASTRGTPAESGRPPTPVHVKRWRDLWLWDTEYLALFVIVPAVVAGILVLFFWPHWGSKALWLFSIELGGLGLAGTYAWVFHRIQRLKAGLPRPIGEVAECLMFWRPFQSPGLAVLHEDRLELIPIIRSPVTVPLEGIVAVSEVRWFNGMRLWSKKGFVLELANGRRIGLAVAEAFARRWRARLSRGTLPEIPADSEPAASPPRTATIHSMVKAPASWLVATGILNWVAIPLIFFVTAGIASQGDSPLAYMILVPLAAFVLSSVMIFAGLKMKRLEAHPLAIIGSILAILVTPGNIIGLPVGIWSLVVLCRREVRGAFGRGYSPLRAETPARAAGDGAWKEAAVIVAAILLLLAIPIGAILLSIAIPAFIKGRERARLVQGEVVSEVPITPPISVSFSPVQEVILNDLDESRGNEALSFASAQRLSLPADFGQRTAEARAAWMDSNRVDLLVDYTRDRWALLGRGLQFRDLHIAAWDAPQIGFGGSWPDTKVLEMREARELTLCLLPTNAVSPMTFTFRTANGDHGVMQITGLFTNDPPGMKLRYKLAKLASGGGRGGGGGGRTTVATQGEQHKSVRLVADKTSVTFEGQPTSWDGVGALLASVPDRKNTVLEFAVTSDQITVAQQNEWFQKASALARQHGFEYASFVGIHPLGSKGTSAGITRTTDQVAVEDLALRMLAAIRDKEDDMLQSLAVDRVKGWRDSLPHFAFEMRERFQQGRGRPFNLLPTESLIEDEYAVVKCDDPKAANQIYLVLHFVRTEDDWKNWSLRNSPPDRPLAEHLKQRPPQ